jgi:ribulose-phosphate 3-epimerase
VDVRLVRISASLYAADPLRLLQDVAAVAPHVASLHVDIMDGRFAPAFGYGERLVRSLIAEAALPVDVHLMIEQPEPWAIRFAALGARSVAFHVEAVADPLAVAASIRAEGSLAYLALLPQTPLAQVSSLLAEVDGVLLLTAPPGGGVFSRAAIERVRELPNGSPTIVDGRLEAVHLEFLRVGGVELAVIGEALFGDRSLSDRARRLASLASGSAA